MNLDVAVVTEAAAAAMFALLAGVSSDALTIAAVFAATSERRRFGGSCWVVMDVFGYLQHENGVKEGA